MSAEDDEVKAEVQAFLASTQMDKTADYSARGRPYQHLAQNELLEAWIRAFKAIVDAGIPGDLVARHRERDLISEIKLRGIEPPYSMVQDAVDRFCSAVVGRVEADPEAMQRVIDSLEADLAKFWSPRESKN
jgi:hypothetical protein